MCCSCQNHKQNNKTSNQISWKFILIKDVFKLILSAQNIQVTGYDWQWYILDRAVGLWRCQSELIHTTKANAWFKFNWIIFNMKLKVIKISKSQSETVQKVIQWENNKITKFHKFPPKKNLSISVKAR